MYCGICVDFPLPVAPCMTTTLLCCSACRKDVRRSEAGSPERVVRMRASVLLLCHARQRSCKARQHCLVQIMLVNLWLRSASRRQHDGVD